MDIKRETRIYYNTSAHTIIVLLKQKLRRGLLAPRCTTEVLDRLTWSCHMWYQCSSSLILYPWSIKLRP